MAIEPAKSWQYFTELVRVMDVDTDFLTRALIGNINLKGGNSKVSSSPIEYIEYEYETLPLTAAPMRGFHDDHVPVSSATQRVKKVVNVYSIPLEDDVDLKEAFDAVPAPATDTQASLARLNAITKKRIADKQAFMKGMIARRIEIMLGQILYDGKISYNDGVFTLTHDFELDSEMFYTVNTTWDNANAEPMKDLVAARKLFSKKTGVAPDLILVGEDVADALLFNPDITSKLNILNADFGSIKPKFDDRNQSMYLMTIRGVGEIYTYFGAYDSSGSKVNYLDKDRVYMVNTRFFRLVYGGIYSTLLNGVKALDFFSYVDEKPNHKGYRVFLESKPMPYVAHPRAVLSMKVLS